MTLTFVKIRQWTRKSWREVLFVGVAFCSICSLVLSVSLLAMSFEREQQLQDTILALRLYDINPELEVTWMDYTTSTITIPILGNPNVFFSEDNTIDRWEYFFMNNHLTLNATFRFVVVKINLPIKAYEHFSKINCEWRVEDKSGVIGKTDFQATGSYFYFEAAQDITRSMWKDEVPSRIDVDVFLYL